MNELLRRLPGVDALAQRLGGGPLAVGAARQVIDEAREGLVAGELSAVPDLDTLGAQRLIAFQFAADVWGAFLDSNVTIQIGVAT